MRETTEFPLNSTGQVTMTLNEIRSALRKQPFAPFRIRLTTGQNYEIRHPEFAAVTQTSMFVGEPHDDDVPVRMVQCDLMHVVALEPTSGPATQE